MINALNEMVLMLAFVLLFTSVVCLVWGLLPDIAGRMIRERVFTELASENRPTLFAQIADLLAPINRFLPSGWYSAGVSSRLQSAGLKMPVMHFLVMQEIGALTGVLVYGITMGAKLNIAWMVILICVGAFIPHFWLGNRISARRMSISRDLPEVVDLLNLCIDAGLDFMSSLARVVREFRFCPATEELGLVVQEVRVGKRRRDALQAFAQRVRTVEAQSFSRTLRQADRMGTGLAEALRILSEDMRIQQYHWAERFAQRAPLKMLVPLLFSLASALLIVAGPIMGEFLKSGFGATSFTAK